MTTISCYVDESGFLCNYRTGETIRRATAEECAESEAAGPTGVIEVRL